MARDTDADDRNGLPEDVADRIGEIKTFSEAKLGEVLRDAFGLGPVPEGKGGERYVYGGGKAGTGMRRPSDGALYDMPGTHRKAVLDRAKELDLIRFVDGGYVTTSKGVETLYALPISSCPDCDGDRIPVAHEYTKQLSRYSTADEVDFRMRCTECESPDRGSYEDLADARGSKAQDRAERAVRSHEDVVLHGVDAGDEWIAPEKRALEQLREELDDEELIEDEYRDSSPAGCLNRVADDFSSDVIPLFAQEVLDDDEISERFTDEGRAILRGIAAGLERESGDNPAEDEIGDVGALEGEHVEISVRIEQTGEYVTFEGEQSKTTDNVSVETDDGFTVRAYAPRVGAVSVFPMLEKHVDLGTLVAIDVDEKEVDGRSRVERAFDDFKSSTVGINSTSPTSAWGRVVDRHDLNTAEQIRFARVVKHYLIEDRGKREHSLPGSLKVLASRRVN